MHTVLVISLSAAPGVQRRSEVLHLSAINSTRQAIATLHTQALTTSVGISEVKQLYDRRITNVAHQPIILSITPRVLQMMVCDCGVLGTAEHASADVLQARSESFHSADLALQHRQQYPGISGIMKRLPTTPLIALVVSVLQLPDVVVVTNWLKP